MIICSLCREGKGHILMFESGVTYQLCVECLKDEQYRHKPLKDLCNINKNKLI